MRVLNILHDYLPEGVHGTSLCAHALAREMAKRGHQVATFCRGYDEKAKDLEIRDYEYQGVSVRRVFWKPPVSFPLTFRDERIAGIYESYQAEFSPDIVHIHHLMNLSSSILRKVKGAGIPVIISLHDFWFICRRHTLLLPSGELCEGPAMGLNCVEECMGEYGHDDELLRFRGAQVSRNLLLAKTRTEYNREMFKLADAVVAHSNHLKDRFTLEGFDHPNFAFIPYGFDLDKLNIEKTESDTTRFLYVGSLIPHKGVHILVDAFLKLPKTAKASLTVSGDLSVDPSYSENLKRAAGNDKRITFAGRVKYERLLDMFSNTDAVVVPSLCYENAPRTISEAHAASIPVIAANVGGMKEFIDDGVNGLLFERGNAHSLAKKMARFLNEPDLKNRLSQKNTLTSVEEHTEAYNNIYKSLVDGKSGK